MVGFGYGQGRAGVQRLGWVGNSARVDAIGVIARRKLGLGLVTTGRVRISVGVRNGVCVLHMTATT